MKLIGPDKVIYDEWK